MKSLMTKAIALLAGAWRYRWQGLALTWLICLGGWLAVWSIPDQYAVEAKIYIDTDTVLGPLMRGLTVPQDQEQQIAIMLKQMTSRPNLEQIIRLTNPRAVKMTTAQMETAVNDLSSHVQMGGAGVHNLFSIGYIDNNSAYAESVTQSLLSVLVDSNVGDKRKDIQGARTFIDAKIDEYAVQLREAEARRSNFKAANLDALSGGGNSLDGANAELIAARNDLGAAEVTVNALKAQLTGVPATIASDQLPVVNDKGATTGGSTDPMVRLQQAEQALVDMRTQYTDDYPGVAEIKRTIAELQKQVAQRETKKDASPTAGTAGVPNPVYTDLRTRLSSGLVALAILQRRVGIASAKLEAAKKNTVQMMQIGNKYADLDRDYNVLLGNYNELVKGREAARMSQSMSDQQQSIAFRIIEPPKRTAFPVSPPRHILNTMVLLAGVGAGVCLALLLSILAGRFTTSDELAEYFSLPLLGVVTVGANVNAVRKQRLSVTLAASGLLTLVAIYGGVMLILTTSIYTKLGI